MPNSNHVIAWRYHIDEVANRNHLRYLDKKGGLHYREKVSHGTEGLGCRQTSRGTMTEGSKPYLDSFSASSLLCLCLLCSFPLSLLSSSFSPSGAFCRSLPYSTSLSRPASSASLVHPEETCFLALPVTGPANQIPRERILTSRPLN